MPDRPARIGPVEFEMLGTMVVARCPSELDPLMRKAGGLWGPAGRCWLIHRWRIKPLIRGPETRHGSAVVRRTTGAAGGDGPGREGNR
jgi:hypothetical protein